MFTDKVLTLVFGLLFLMMIACGDNSENKRRQQDGNPPVVQEQSRSAAFLDYAASTNMLQTELAKIAIKRAQQEDVKALAEQMLAFYGEAQKDLQQVARAEGLQNSLPDSLGTADKAMVEEFRKLPAAEFDKRYQQYINSSHRSQLDRYQEMLLRTEEQKIRDWVSDMQSQLQARLGLAGQHDTAQGSK